MARNPLRSEGEAFRFLIVVIGGAIVIVIASLINVWLGVAAAVLVVGGIVWWFFLASETTAPPPRVTSATPPGQHRVLVVAAPGADATSLRGSVGGATEIVVVVPAVASTVEQVTGAVDDRRAEAEQTAQALASGLTADGLRARGEVGADDPVQAIDDALRTFGADAIVIAGGDDALLAEARERFALPITALRA